MSQKSNLSIKENFLIAVENYKKNNFLIAENICNKILSIDAHHFESLVLLSNILSLSLLVIETLFDLVSVYNYYSI